MNTWVVPRLFVEGAALLYSLSSTAQPHWGPVGIETSLPGLFNALYASNDGERLYYGGWRDFDPNQANWQNMLVKITAGGIQYIPVPGGINSIVEYHDTLFVGGAFETSPNDSTPAYNVEYWSDTGWAHLGVFDQWDVRSLRVLDDTLYAVGSFSEVDGQACTGMVRLINGQWQPLAPLPEPGAISDIIKFDEKLVASGGIYIGDQDGIAYLQGNDWHILGPGLEAGFSSIQRMLLYQGELYVGGQIEITPNNPGRDIMRWDGTQFHELGVVGLQRNLGDDSGFSTVGDMTEHNGLLYVGGGFRFAGGIPANGVASWDGTVWCSIPGNLSDGQGYVGARGIAFLEDSLFVICGHLADSDSVNLAAKFIGESYEGPCASDVLIAESTAFDEHKVFPNPASSWVRFDPPLNRDDQIIDAFGRERLRLTAPMSGLDISSWPRGLYTICSGIALPSWFVLY